MLFPLLGYSQLSAFWSQLRYHFLQEALPEASDWARCPFSQYSTVPRACAITVLITLGMEPCFLVHLTG